MNRVRAAWILVVGLVGLASTAHALPPRVHRDIAERACATAGLPRELCRRAGVAAYDVDADEWDDMSAHAQIAPGTTACASANATAARLAALGGRAAQAIGELSRRSTLETRDALAVAVGRALHTVQDECAHRGMPNTQHAWRSLSDVCEGTTLSPDAAPEATACAERESAALLEQVAAAVRGASLSTRALADGLCDEPDTSEGGGARRGPCDDVYLPAPWDACSFLGEAEAWDGADLRWRHDAVGPTLLAAFDAGLAGATAPTVCAPDTDDAAILAAPEAGFDVAGGPPSCTRIHLLCLGKADGEGLDLHDAAAAAAAPGGEAAAGCSAVASESRPASRVPGLVGVALALAAVARRRRRR